MTDKPVVIINFMFATFNIFIFILNITILLNKYFQFQLLKRNLERVIYVLYHSEKCRNFLLENFSVSKVRKNKIYQSKFIQYYIFNSTSRQFPLIIKQNNILVYSFAVVYKTNKIHFLCPPPTFENHLFSSRQGCIFFQEF